MEMEIMLVFYSGFFIPKGYYLGQKITLSALAKAGFHLFFPEASPNNVDRYHPIFECNHRAHLECL